MGLEVTKGTAAVMEASDGSVPTTEISGLDKTVAGNLTAHGWLLNGGRDGAESLKNVNGGGSDAIKGGSRFSALDLDEEGNNGEIFGGSIAAKEAEYNGRIKDTGKGKEIRTLKVYNKLQKRRVLTLVDHMWP